MLQTSAKVSFRPARERVNILHAIGERNRAAVEAEAERVSIPAGHVLFNAGDFGEDLYFVESGSLGVYLDGPTGERQLIALIGPGETVGEMAVISDAPRSATVSAVRDSELLRLKGDSFARLVRTAPELMVELCRLLARRLRHTSRGGGAQPEPKTVAFLPGTAGAHTREAAERLVSELKALGLRACALEPSTDSLRSGWLDQAEAENDHVILWAGLDDREGYDRCARQADRIVLIAETDADHVAHMPEALMRQRSHHRLLDLVLLHNEPGAVPYDTMTWLGRFPVNRHFHIRLGEKRDWQRFARIIAGRAVGLVLSGGGARAYAHLGVLKALNELGITIDFVGGTSMGAIVGGCLAMDWPLAEVESRIRTAFVHNNPLSDITLPYVGLVKGRKIERLLVENFGTTLIPDLWLPYFCVSSNLTSGGIEVHTRDTVADSLRASIALPGIVPPKVMNGRVLADGAVMNNMPVDVMRTLHRGTIIAVDVARDLKLTPEMLQPTARAAWFGRIINLPIVNILMRSGTISSEETNRRQWALADVVLVPPLGPIEIRDWHAIDQAMELGYAHAMSVLTANPLVTGEEVDG